MTSLFIIKGGDISHRMGLKGSVCCCELLVWENWPVKMLQCGCPTAPALVSVAIYEKSDGRPVLSETCPGQHLPPSTH